MWDDIEFFSHSNTYSQNQVGIHPKQVVHASLAQIFY